METGFVEVRGTTLHATWVPAIDIGGNASQGPVHEWLIRVAKPDTEVIVTERRLPVTVLSTDFTDMEPGTYDVLGFGINDSGIMGGFWWVRTIEGPPSPQPTVTARPSSMPKPIPTTRPSHSPRPSAPTTEPSASPSSSPFTDD